MKKVELISEDQNYTAVNIGSLNDISSYSFIHPKLGTEVRGKVFLKEHTKSTGTEISFTRVAPKSELGYFHLHFKDEETYIIIKGSGYYQVDDKSFPIQEGSVIRVSPAGVRSLCNTSDEEMIYICIQSKANSLEEYSMADGQRVKKEANWNI